MNTPDLHFWFEFASTYSYLSVARIEDEAAVAGVAVRWEPFLLGPVFAEQSWDGLPFNVYPAKAVWREVTDVAPKEALSFVLRGRQKGEAEVLVTSGFLGEHVQLPLLARHHLTVWVEHLY